jgi:hypothetical protein
MAALQTKSLRDESALQSVITGGQVAPILHWRVRRSEPGTTFGGRICRANEYPA